MKLKRQKGIVTNADVQAVQVSKTVITHALVRLHEGGKEEIYLEVSHRENDQSSDSDLYKIEGAAEHSIPEGQNKLMLKAMTTFIGWKARLDYAGRLIGADAVEWGLERDFVSGEENICRPRVLHSLPPSFWPELKLRIAARDGASAAEEAKYLLFRNPLTQSILKEDKRIAMVTYDLGYNLKAVPLYINGQIWGARVSWNHPQNIPNMESYPPKKLKIISAEEFAALP